MQVMMSLGSFQFGVSTVEYQNLKTNRAWRWEKKDRYGRKPAKQYIGPDADIKKFEITIYPHSRADLTRYLELAALADLGEPVRLISAGTRMLGGLVEGVGVDLGLWCIEKLDVDENMFMGDGTALEQKGALSLSEYGEDVY